MSSEFPYQTGDQSRLKYVNMYMSNVNPKPKIFMKSRFAGDTSEVNVINFKP